MAVETLTAELVGKSTGYSEMMKGAIEQANSWGSTLQQAGTAATAAMRTAGGMSARDELHGAISEVYESGNDDVVDAIGRVEELLKGKGGQVNVLGADLL